MLLVLERLVRLFGESARTDPPQEEVIALCAHESNEVRTWALRILSDRAFTRFHQFDGLVHVEDLARGVELEMATSRRDPDEPFAVGERQSSLLRMVYLTPSPKELDYEHLRAIYDAEMAHQTAAQGIPAGMLG